MFYQQWITLKDKSFFSPGICLSFVFLWCAVVFKTFQPLQTLLWYDVFKAYIFEVNSLLLITIHHISYLTLITLICIHTGISVNSYTFICFYFTIHSLSQVEKSYRLSCVPPKCICWSTNLQCNSIWRWDLWEKLGLDEVMIMGHNGGIDAL